MRNVQAGGLRGWVFVVLAGILLSGCMENRILIKVKKDGSGNIIVTKIASKETVVMFTAQMEEMKKQLGNNAMGMQMPDDPFYNEDALRREAGRFGPGVIFVKGKKYEKAGARGSIALYAFEDIDDIFVNLKYLGSESGMAPFMMNAGGDEIVIAEKEVDAFEFRLVKGAPNELKIVLPTYPDADAESDQEEDDEESDEEGIQENAVIAGGGPPGGPAANPQMQMMMAGGNPYGFTGNESQEEVMLRMLKGMKMDFSVEVEGTIVKSDASYPHKTKKNRYILLQMNMDKIMTSPKAKKMMSPPRMVGTGSPVEFFAPMRNILPGIIIETKKEVKIKFE